MPPVRRNIFLINKPFQFRFALYVCSWLFALSFIYPLVVDNMFLYFANGLSAEGGSRLTAAGIEQTRSAVFWLLVASQTVFLGLAFLISLFMAFRIAGPLYKLRLLFEKAREGVLRERLIFRKGDFFQEVAEDYNGMMEQVATRIEQLSAQNVEAADQIEKALPQVEGAARLQLEEALQKLRAIPKSQR